MFLFVASLKYGDLGWGTFCCLHESCAKFKRLESPVYVPKCVYVIFKSYICIQEHC